IITTNDTAALTRGAEVVLDWRPEESLNLSFTYSFLDVEIDAPATAIDGQAPEGRSPRHQANVRVHWAANERLAIDTSVYFVEELPDFDIEAYVRTDLRVSYRLTERVQFDLVAQNLLDDAHREFTAAGDANAAAIRHTLFGRLTWRP
ncbi:MAG TPA: TonB-dependent receptor, partial [Verrucomicrobiae bacterium]|nr:TonB-dependent receptor [Verrucomicrobiae bacterium]